MSIGNVAIGIIIFEDFRRGKIKRREQCKIWNRNVWGIIIRELKDERIGGWFCGLFFRFLLQLLCSPNPHSQSISFLCLLPVLYTSLVFLLSDWHFEATHEREKEKQKVLGASLKTEGATNRTFQRKIISLRRLDSSSETTSKAEDRKVHFSILSNQQYSRSPQQMNLDPQDGRHHQEKRVTEK